MSGKGSGINALVEPACLRNEHVALLSWKSQERLRLVYSYNRRSRQRKYCRLPLKYSQNYSSKIRGGGNIWSVTSTCGTIGCSAVHWILEGVRRDAVYRMKRPSVSHASFCTKPEILLLYLHRDFVMTQDQNLSLSFSRIVADIMGGRIAALQNQDDGVLAVSNSCSAVSDLIVSARCGR